MSQTNTSNKNKCENVNEYEIRWIINPPLKIGKQSYKASFGFCEKTKNIAMLNVMTTDPFMFYHVKITNGNSCEIKSYCLDLQCPFNKASKESYAKYYGLDKNDLKTHQQWKNLLQHMTETESILSGDQERLWSGEHHNLMFP